MRYFFVMFRLLGCATVPEIDCNDSASIKAAWDKASDECYKIARREMPEEHAYWVYSHVLFPNPEDEGFPPPYYLFWENEAHDTHPDNYEEFYNQAHDDWIRTVEIRMEVISNYPYDFGAWSVH